MPTCRRLNLSRPRRPGRRRCGRIGSVAMDLMRAFHVPAPGQPTRLGELPVPEIAEGTVLVRVRAAGLNPIDKLIAAGMLTGLLPHEYPLVLGRDAAGVVEAVGAGVEHVRVGDEVLGHILLAS